MPDAAAATAPVVEKGHAASHLHGWWDVDLDSEQTPELRWPLSIRIYDAMRRQDAQLGSVLRAVTLPVRRTPWRVDAEGCRPEVARFVADDLGLPLVGEEAPPRPRRARGRFSWSEHLRLALLSLVYGHSYFEQVYRIDAQGFAHLRKLGWRPPRTIARFDVASDGGLNAIEQYAPAGAQGGNLVIPISRLVAYVNEREGSNWLGQSLLRAAYKNWLIKDRLLRVDAQTIERNGMGVPVYTAQEKATQADIDKGKDLAAAYRAGDAAGAGLPYGAKLELKGVEGSLPTALPSIRYHDEQMARAVLAHFLNLGTQTGSWALGTTFADFFIASLQAVAQDHADVANQHIVEDLVDLNFGEDEPAPRIVFDEIGSHQAATAAAIKLLVDAGVIVPDAKLEEAVRQSMDLPAKGDDDPAPTPEDGA